MDTLEFQKRRLPHAHIITFLHLSNKYPTPGDIDKIIGGEISNPLKEPRSYNLVKNHMVYGPCDLDNRNSPCMKDDKCSKVLSKKIPRLYFS